MALAALEARNVTVRFGKQSALHGVNFSVQAGEYVCLVGANGSGKTTLLRTLLGIQTPAAGQVLVGGRDISCMKRSELAATLAYVPQHLEVPFSFTVLDFVAMARFPFQRGLLGFSNADRSAVAAALERMQVTHLAERSLASLSGGERQRVSVAAALAQEPKVLLLDEVTRSLDPLAERQMSLFLRELCVRSGVAMVSATHDLNRAAYDSQRVVALRDGRIVCNELGGQFLRPDILERVYGSALRLIRDQDSGRGFIVPEVD